MALQDTDPAFEALQIDKIAKLSPTERMRRFFGLCQLARGFVIAGIMQRYPECSAEELRKRLAAITLGKELSKKYFDWDPEIQGY